MGCGSVYYKYYKMFQQMCATILLWQKFSNWDKGWDFDRNHFDYLLNLDVIMYEILLYMIKTEQNFQTNCIPLNKHWGFSNLLS